MKIFGFTISLGGKAQERAAGERPAKTPQAADGLTVTIRMGTSGTLDNPCHPGAFYVYRHRGPDGAVFYVGKGTGNRAWSKDRPSEHQQYVEQFCGGCYAVEIVRDGVSEDDALTLEDLLMQQHCDTIVNLQNIHAPIASDRFAAYCAAQRAEQAAMQRARSARDATKIEEAAAAFEEAYRQWLLMRDYSDYTQGARSSFQAPFPLPTAIAHEYTVMLSKAAQHAELIAFVDRLERDWGSTFATQAAESLLKRRDRSRRKAART